MIKNGINEYCGLCCFCNQRIQVTEIDPCGINIMGHWDREVEHRASQDFFCHLDCLGKQLHKECGESRNNEVSKSEFICCFCNELIEKTNVDPCNIDIVACLDKPKNERFSQGYCFHFACLETRLHSYFKGYFIEETFSIEDDEPFNCGKHFPCSDLNCLFPPREIKNSNNKN